MDAKEFAHELRDTVADLRIKGVESIRSENLIKYLDEELLDLATSPKASGSASNELYKAELQKWVEEHKNVHAHSVELFRSVILAGQNALRTAFLMNGGAAVALLAFVGHLATTDPHRVPSLAPSLTMFVGGVLVAALGGLEVDDEVEFGRPRDWKITRIGSPQDAINEASRLAGQVVRVGRIGHQDTRHETGRRRSRSWSEADASLRIVQRSQDWCPRLGPPAATGASSLLIRGPRAWPPIRHRLW